MLSFRGLTTSGYWEAMALTFRLWRPLRCAIGAAIQAWSGIRPHLQKGIRAVIMQQGRLAAFGASLKNGWPCNYQPDEVHPRNSSPGALRSLGGRRVISRR